MPDRATTAGYDVLYAVFSCRSPCHPARRCVIDITVRVWRQAARPCWTPSTEVKSTWPSSSSTLASMMSSTRETSTAKHHWYEQSTSRSWLSTLYVSRSGYLGQDLLSLYWHSGGCRLVKQESRAVARKRRDAACFCLHKITLRLLFRWSYRPMKWIICTVTPTNDDIADPVGSGAEPQPKSNLVHISLKIWHLVATILMIYLRINWTNFFHAVKHKLATNWVYLVIWGSRAKPSKLQSHYLQLGDGLA